MRSRPIHLVLLAAVAMPCFAQTSPSGQQPKLTTTMEDLQSLAKDAPRTYAAHMRLAELHEGRKNWALAMSHYKKALKFQQRELGPAHIDVAATHDRIAQSHLRANYPGYQDKYSSCTGSYSPIGGDPSPPCRTVRQWVPASGPNYGAAVSAMNDALAIRMKSWGANSFQLVPFLVRLCVVQRSAGKTKQAMVPLAQARSIATGRQIVPKTLNPKRDGCAV